MTDGYHFDSLKTCPSCGGTGDDGAFHPCAQCRGDGVVSKGGDAATASLHAVLRPVIARRSCGFPVAGTPPAGSLITGADDPASLLVILLSRP
jgi:hypothetical protein